ncbi:MULTISPECIES: hypothetical protein [unclassified Streptomyces]|uniref:COG4315 family predicted lipoprotein n=1 Tax=unclassified Streptomyces TaxID=2593676 RepID=UPI00382E76A1
MRINTRTVSALAAAALGAAVVAGCSGSGSGSSATKEDVSADLAAASASPSMSPPMAASSPAADAGKVSAKMVGMYGEILVNHKDRTLYLFAADKLDPTTKKYTSACTGDCAKVWVPLTVHHKPEAGTGPVKASWLATITRADGTEQVTYDGHPLYTFKKDLKAGETHGQDVKAYGAKWYVVGADGKAVTTPPPSLSPSPTPSY